MIAKAKAVAHGIRAMLYVSGESRNKKHPERITRICDNFMPQGMDATGIFTEMKFATMNHPNIKNNVIRKSSTRTERWFPRRQTYRAASHPSGCMRNPTAEYLIFMPLSAAWTRTGTSTMTTPYTSAHNGRQK